MSLQSDIKRGRGRPASGNALSDAERARRYRERKKVRDSSKPLSTSCEAGFAQVQELQVELEQARNRIRELGLSSEQNSSIVKFLQERITGAIHCILFYGHKINEVKAKLYEETGIYLKPRGRQETLYELYNLEKKLKLKN
ncbi:hypothetical protein B4V94_22035 [Salmonella enterica subsp. diarizonae]|uniref:Uncharacterized protein n=1 Tax=Salmonella diarizonae TaxID=59204 RepID=A0A635JC07_SALDZ|nr:hypothetical protein [Salmonella enterica subsp. diarizonae]